MPLAKWLIALMLALYPGMSGDTSDIEVYTVPHGVHASMVRTGAPFNETWRSHSFYTSAFAEDGHEVILLSDTARTIAARLPGSFGESWLARLTKQEVEYLISLRNEHAAVQEPATPYYGFLNSREQKLFNAMNRERVTAGLPALVIDRTLTNIARIRSQDMTEKRYFSHFSPTGESVYTLTSRYGLQASALGENLARVSGDPDRSVSVAIERLMQSPPHRANILNSAYTKVGMGAVTSEDGVTVFTMIFYAE